jgi:NAD(P)-dependent dehydrogenase (short-subunit alcohol dehydrogenase family)
MRERKWGRVIFLSSMAAKMPIAGLLLSNTARSGLLGFAKTLSNELAKDGVTVNSVLPGHFDTQRAIDLARMRSEREGKPIEDVMKARMSSTPMVPETPASSPQSSRFLPAVGRALLRERPSRWMAGLFRRWSELRNRAIGQTGNASISQAYYAS